MIWKIYLLQISAHQNYDNFLDLSENHCIKSVRIRSDSGPHFPTFGLNTDRMRENADQNISEYGHFLSSE